MKKVIVISLGGSLIYNKNCEIDVKFLKQFKKVILNNKSKFRFIIVAGGGSLARKYISAIEQIKGNTKMQSLSGIAATRTNARFVSYFFGIEPKKGIPLNTASLKQQLKESDIIFCGALGYKEKQTSDSTATNIAKQFDAKFVNLSNVSGLYNKDPAEHKNAKFISKISWKDFHKMASKLGFKPGQHFVLDQTAAKIIMKNKIIAYLLGRDIKNLNNLLNEKTFNGTTING